MPQGAFERILHLGFELSHPLRHFQQPVPGSDMIGLFV